MLEVVPTISNKGGKLWLNIKRIIPEYTSSKLASLREQTNERLRKEGIFENNKNLSFPFLPVNLGILTSSTGTVINDFMASLDEAKFGFKLTWLSVAVQGSEAKKSIVNGIRQLSKIKDLDVILIFRGGGSPAELAVFNDYEVAKAICLCPLPVISAVGHQEDQSSTQDVSYLAQGVPKDIGTFFANLVLSYRKNLFDFTSRIQNSAKSIYENSTYSFVSSSRSILNLSKKNIEGRGFFFNLQLLLFLA